MATKKSEIPLVLTRIGTHRDNGLSSDHISAEMRFPDTFLNYDNQDTAASYGKENRNISPN